MNTDHKDYWSSAVCTGVVLELDLVISNKQSKGYVIFIKIINLIADDIQTMFAYVAVV